jgi:decaprenyl-phosphate phosphoribosyltransferase
MADIKSYEYPLSRSASGLLQLMRPKQWIKNAFVAAPVFFTPGALSVSNSLLVAGGVIVFCAASSAIYAVNDIIDRDADLLHPLKRRRPIPSGMVRVPVAIGLAAALSIAAAGTALLISAAFGAIVSG